MINALCLQYCFNIYLLCYLTFTECDLCCKSVCVGVCVCAHVCVCMRVSVKDSFSHPSKNVLFLLIVALYLKCVFDEETLMYFYTSLTQKHLLSELILNCLSFLITTLFKVSGITRFGNTMEGGESAGRGT